MKVSYSTAFSIYSDIVLSRPLKEWQPGIFVETLDSALRGLGWSLSELHNASQRSMQARWHEGIKHPRLVH